LEGINERNIKKLKKDLEKLNEREMDGVRDRFK
jgi:hypothetical protein